MRQSAFERNQINTISKKKKKSECLALILNFKRHQHNQMLRMDCRSPGHSPYYCNRDTSCSRPPRSCAQWAPARHHKPPSPLSASPASPASSPVGPSKWVRRGTRSQVPDTRSSPTCYLTLQPLLPRLRPPWVFPRPPPPPNLPDKDHPPCPGPSCSAVTAGRDELPLLPNPPLRGEWPPPNPSTSSGRPLPVPRCFLAASRAALQRQALDSVPLLGQAAGCGEAAPAPAGEAAGRPRTAAGPSRVPSCHQAGKAVPADRPAQSRGLGFAGEAAATAGRTAEPDSEGPPALLASG